MHGETQIIEADLTWTGNRFESAIQIELDKVGNIRQVGTMLGPTTRRLVRRALLPGFINAHSHAFQRGLRGLGESYPAGAGDFWSWREAMYDLVLRLDTRQAKQLCKQAFDEMLAGGFTTVGEFHYLHHSNLSGENGKLEDGDFAFDKMILDAAAESGIRIVLLQSFYKTGGIGRPLVGGQRRFATPDVDAFVAQVNQTEMMLRGPLQSIGLAPHSLRAVPPADLVRLHDIARERGWVCHVHIEEQRKEIAEAVAALGSPPLEWFLENLRLGPHFTMIHATHSTNENLLRYVDRGANICVCPITEGNLGDGLGDVATMLSRRDSVCIGTDSNVRIDAAEELRWLEFVRRLRHERRGICVDEAGELGTQLLRCGTENGARSLNIPAGKIEAGCLADFVAIDLDAPSLAGATPDSLANAFLLGSSGAAIREVCVGGRWVR